jgi:hypothetical protein
MSNVGLPGATPSTVTPDGLIPSKLRSVADEQLLNLCMQVLQSDATVSPDQSHLLLDCRSQSLVSAQPTRKQYFDIELAPGYRTLSRQFLGLDSPDVHRDGLVKFTDFLVQSMLASRDRTTSVSTFLSRLKETDWMHHVKLLLASAGRIARVMMVSRGARSSDSHDEYVSMSIKMMKSKDESDAASAYSIFFAGSPHVRSDSLSDRVGQLPASGFAGASHA